MAGAVYVLTSDYYKSKNLYQIGYTTDNLSNRISNLNKSCGLEELEFYCVHEWQVSDCRQQQKKLHSEFDRKREEGEFFKLSLNDLDKLVQMMNHQSNSLKISSNSDDQPYDSACSSDSDFSDQSHSFESSSDNDSFDDLSS